MLTVSPIIAQTLGLEEALLLQLLHDMQLCQGNNEVIFSDQQRDGFLPFWSENQFGLILNRLQALGIIEVSGAKPWTIHCDFPDFSQQQTPRPVKSSPAPIQVPAAPEPQSEPVPVYAMNEARQRNQYDDDLAYLKPNNTPRNNVKARKTKMHMDWEPTADFPQLLSFHDIPLQFALSELAKFRQYYSVTDRTEISWDVRFLNWVQRAWHDSLNAKGRNDRQQKSYGEPADSTRDKRAQVRDALRNIRDTDW